MAEAPGRIITFYSYKGGTGRSMALANFAWIVAASGKRVLAIDWDLEAPGLHRYFRPFLADPDLFETDGLIDAFWSFAASALAKIPSSQTRTLPMDSEEIVEALEDATRRLNVEAVEQATRDKVRKKGVFRTGGYIDFIGAGRQGGTYSERVNSFDWKRFYELGGADVLTAAKAHLRRQYDWVLIDSRTGVSDTAGICTIQMPDAVIACFTLNRQSIDGVAAILRSIRAFHGASVDGQKIELYPVATRIENAEQARLEVARGYARKVLANFLPDSMQWRSREYWDKMEIAYRPAYAFEEVLAAFGDATGATGAADTMLSQTEAMAQLITGDSTLRMPEIVEADRAHVLSKYSFGVLPSAVAKAAMDDGDTEFLRGVRTKEQLWRTSRFAWRRLLSRRELDLLTDQDRKGFGRNMAFYLLQSVRMQQLCRTNAAVGPIIVGLAFIIVFVSELYFRNGKLWLEFMDLRVEVWAPLLAYSLGVGMFLAFVWTLVAGRDKPYGVAAIDIFMLTLLGPFQPVIRDYVPEEEDEK
jgi:MinD-like ATPase involved in chromosome partitioning or flagellar assembly